MRGRRSARVVLVGISAAAVVLSACGTEIAGQAQGEAGAVGVVKDATDESSETVEPAPSTVETTEVEPTEEPAETERSITIHYMYVAGDSGGTGDTIITRSAPRNPGDFRVQFSGDTVGGTGQQSQAGAWNAAIASVLLLGQPLEGTFSFETDGMVDGPSAGALTTVGIMALARGTEIDPHATMTGTINTSGLVGPVGGIPEKIAGTVAAGFTKILIPLGQRNTPDHSGQMVDVINLGDRLGAQVIEVGDIYQAYSELTGDQIDVPGVMRDPILDNTSYNKIKPQTDAVMSRFQTALKQFERLPDDLQQMFGGDSLSVAYYFANQSEKLQQQGLQAGAFQVATLGTAMMEALANIGELYSPLYTQGEKGLATVFAHAQDTSDTERAFMSLLDQLSGYTPHTIADVEGLISAYGQSFDAYALLMFAQDQIAAIQQQDQNGAYSSLDALLGDLAVPTMMSALSASLVESTKSLFEIGRDNPGAPIAEDVDLQQLGEFFNLGAEANYAAFTADFIHPYAAANGVSDDVMLNYIANADLSIAISVAERNIAPAIANYIGEGKPNADYAMLAYGLQNFARNQGLLNKYYNNAKLDENFNVVGVQFDKVMLRALDLGRQQLASEINLLRETGTEPVLSVASYEAAGLSRSGDVADQFDAMTSYDGAFLVSRMMAYLAGINQTISGG